MPMVPFPILARARSLAASVLADVLVRNPANFQMLRVNLQLSRSSEANVGKHATLRVPMLASEFLLLGLQ